MTEAKTAKAADPKAVALATRLCVQADAERGFGPAWDTFDLFLLRREASGAAYDARLSLVGPDGEPLAGFWRSGEKAWWYLGALFTIRGGGAAPRHRVSGAPMSPAQAQTAASLLIDAVKAAESKKEAADVPLRLAAAYMYLYSSSPG